LKVIAILGAEFRRTIQLVRSYWLEYVFDFLLYGLGYILLIVIFTAGSESYGPEGYLSTLIGYVIWKIGASLMVDIARISSEESRTGTLEQMFLTGWGLGRIFLARSTGILLNHSVRGLFLGAVLAAILNILQPIPLLSTLVFLLIILGAGGLGFALAGIVLVHKRLDGFLHLFWQMLVFFTGALAPIQSPILGTIAKLLPLTWGIDALRAIFIDGADVIALWHSGILIGLLLNTLFYMSIGTVVFSLGQKQARTLGVMAHY
jgi:ABC-2 type transport system permease protein